MTYFSSGGQAKPTFLLIGAQKCGTTWLSRMLLQHPQIAVPAKKELHFFNKSFNFARGINWYEKQFVVTEKTRAIGEFTPNYFWTSTDEQEIAESNRTRDIPGLVYGLYPDLQLIVSLRNPVNRAISAYFHHIRAGRISPPTRILDVKDRFGIETMGYYDIHLSRWLQYFDRKRVLILFCETDLSDQNKPATLRQIFDHIGVARSFQPKGIFEHYNVRDTPFELRIRRLPNRIRSLLERTLPRAAQQSSFWRIRVSDDEKDALKEIFAPHNERLFQLLNRESVWPG
jgi:hypothetical protein